MDDFDEADLDGDGEFDAIDMMILEGEDLHRKQPTGNTGCAVVFLVLGVLPGGALLLKDIVSWGSA